MLAVVSAGPLLADVSLNPDPTKLPGGQTLAGLVDGAAGLALIACLAALIIAAVVWAFGHHTGNYNHSAKGKTGVIVAIAAAFVIGMGATLINFAHKTGTAVSNVAGQTGHK